jgi:spoIIIJ-associated protein
MPLEDKVAAAKQIDQLLRTLLSAAGFLLKYRIIVDPPVEENRDWERPQILVSFSGPDGPLLLERGAELLRSLEHITQKMLRLESEDHDKVVFDCMNHRAMRLEELRLAASVAAEKVLKTGVPYHFAPMSARERRILHLALRDHSELTTQSQGEGPRRCVVVVPKNARPSHK